MRIKEVVINLKESKNIWQGIPGIEITQNGRLFVSWFTGGEKEPKPENKVCLQISDDNGKTYSTPEILVDPEGETRAFDPTLWIDPDGKLWLIYNQGNHKTGEHGVYSRVCENPDADTLVWSEPRRLGFDVPHSYRMNKITVLSTGEWIMPVTWSQDVVMDWFDIGKELQGVGISHDQGQSWEFRGKVEAPKWALENMIIEKNDGSVEMYIRAGGGKIYKSISNDKGQSWGEAIATDIVNPCSRFYIRKLSSGNWLLINTPDAEKREKMYAYISKDEGQSWSKGLLLDDRDAVSYPDAVEADNGFIYAIHDRDRYGVGEIIVSVFREADILND